MIEKDPVTATECADELQKLLDGPSLTLAVRGGGIPEEQSIIPQHWFLLNRGQLESTIRFLRGTP
jgi:hypothetical protein